MSSRRDNVTQLELYSECELYSEFRNQVEREGSRIRERRSLDSSPFSLTQYGEQPAPGKTVTMRWLATLNLGVTRTKRRLDGLEAALLVRTFTIRMDLKDTEDGE